MFFLSVSISLSLSLSLVTFAASHSGRDTAEQTLHTSQQLRPGFCFPICNHVCRSPHPLMGPTDLQGPGVHCGAMRQFTHYSLASSGFLPQCASNAVALQTSIILTRLRGDLKEYWGCLQCLSLLRMQTQTVPNIACMCFVCVGHAIQMNSHAQALAASFKSTSFLSA